MITDEKREEIAMNIIAGAGSARSRAFDAIEAARQGDFGHAEEMLGQADAALHDAQEAHRELLQLYALGEIPQLDVLLSHAQDHFMTAMLAKDLAGELVQVYRQLKSDPRRNGA